MPVARTKLGFEIDWEAEHRDRRGNLISRQAKVNYPERPAFDDDYMRRMRMFRLLTAYHNKRVAFCERHRHENIPEKYRVGEPQPETEKELIREIERFDAEC